MIAAVRIRGTVNVPKDVKDTLKMLKLDKINSCVVVPDSPTYRGMLQKSKDFITYGDVDKETLVKLLKGRGRIVGDKPVTVDYLKKTAKVDSFEKFADELMKGKTKLNEVKWIKPVFRLNPPRKGLKSIKLPYPKGALGNRKDKMSELLKRMM